MKGDIRKFYVIQDKNVQLIGSTVLSKYNGILARFHQFLRINNLNVGIVRSLQVKAKRIPSLSVTELRSMTIALGHPNSLV